jgi:hypothetical protein
VGLMRGSTIVTVLFREETQGKLKDVCHVSCRVSCREDRARVLQTNKQSSAVEHPLNACKPVTGSGKGKPAVYCKKSKWQEAATQAD